MASNLRGLNLKWAIASASFEWIVPEGQGILTLWDLNEQKGPAEAGPNLLI